MNVRTLNRKLGKDMVATRDGQDIRIRTKDGDRPVEFRMDRTWKDADEAAWFLKSKMPVAAPRPT